MTTGLQAYQLAVVRLLEAAHEQMSPREFVTLLVIVQAWLEAELQRQDFARRRWAA